MFKHLIQNDTRISITSGTNRLVFPVHPGLVFINSKYGFHFFYHKHNINKYHKLVEKIYDKRVVIPYNTQIYRLNNTNVSVNIPFVYNKNINIPQNCLLSVNWENNSDFLNSIKVISSEQANEIMNEELLMV